MNESMQDPRPDPLSQACGLLDIADAHAAMALIQPHVRRQPGDPRARRLQACALLQLNRPEQALEALDIAETYLRTGAAEADLAERAELDVLRSQALGRLGRHDQAISALKTAVARQPDHRIARRRLACLLRQTGQVERAIHVGRTLLEIEPNDPATLRLLAGCYEAIGCADKALALYQRLDQCGQTTRISLSTARLLWRAGRLAEAVDAYDLLVAMSGEDAGLALEAAALAGELGDDRRATGYLEAVLSIRPRHAEALKCLAGLLMRAGRFERAGRLWWRYGQVERSAVDAVAGLLICAAMTHRDRLADRCGEVLDRRFDVSERQQAIARLWRIGMSGRLLRDLFEAHAIETPDELLPELLAEADQAIEQHLRDHPGHADLHYHRGLVRRAIGQTDQAARSFDRALRINGGYLAAARQRIDLLLVENNLDAAEAVIHAVRQHRGMVDTLLDFELALNVFRHGAGNSIPLLVERCDDLHVRACLAEQVAEVLMRHDDTLADQWIACCRRHPDLPEPFAWRTAA